MVVVGTGVDDAIRQSRRVSNQSADRRAPQGFHFKLRLLDAGARQNSFESALLRANKKGKQRGLRGGIGLWVSHCNIDECRINLGELLLEAGLGIPS